MAELFDSPESASLRAVADALVRPGELSVDSGETESFLLARTGRGSGRIGKDTAVGPVPLRSMVALVAESGDRPLLLSVNQEGGRLNALDWPGTEQLPGALALGAADSEELAALAGAATGAQLRATGLRWNLAPVCDLARWPSARVVGARAFGPDPGRVAALAAAFVRGCQKENVAACAKHFPGLGTATTDPHETLTVVDALPPGSLLPFREAVGAGVASVMVGSHVVRCFGDRPAFASPEVLALLREELGFDGVAVSENLSIPAAHAPFGSVEAAAVAAVAAGIDVVMLDSEISRGGQDVERRIAAIHLRQRVVAALCRAVEKGSIPAERVYEAARRVTAMRARYGLRRGETLPPWAAANHRAKAAALTIARAGLAVPRGQDLLPLPERQAVVVARVPDRGSRRADSARFAPHLLPECLARSVPVTSAEPASVVPGTGPVLVCGYDTTTPSGGSASAVAANRIAASGRFVVHVSFGTLDEFDGSLAPVLIAAGSPHAASVQAVAEALLGRLRPSGRLPIGGPW
ncbi:glycoside hydrolase family 3 N-terminal domain-containing protein [Streptomyces sp. NPDC049954]|uniref:glycoside hydrolase family 3 N-terminal domain-containing protein n=1 Tax=Streptomyces sp. NPDC049954 TaxID=3155779 RepID=UPI003425D514